MEERNLKISINTAREWYNGNNEGLKALALQVFSANELDYVYPKTWEEFCYDYPINKNNAFIDECGIIYNVHSNNIGNINTDKNLLPNKKCAVGILALCQLTQLRDCYRHGWEPNWSICSDSYKYIINFTYDKISSAEYKHDNTFLSFQSAEIRDEFLKNFKDLIYQAKEYI